MKTKHQDESGKSTTNRGKPPHKNGYSAKMKGVNPFKVYFTKTVMVLVEGRPQVKSVGCESGWNPGREKRKLNPDGSKRLNPRQSIFNRT